ncbi:Hormone-sensitive lipase [Yarrowia sp. C11]|nr:Hormone-sensitive lipase [Yarrowia sp. C11]KAG5370833.1 Hormone-sensitive lipase [Yarrowia sp. E02]
MIDQILGRPSAKFKRVQCFAVALVWWLIVTRGNKHGPPGIRSLSRALTAKITAWQIYVLTLTGYYIVKNFDKLVGLTPPTPFENHYTPGFYRATWVMQALDAGFWTAYPIKNKYVRDLMSIVLTMYYLVFSDAADEKVRRFRLKTTVESCRVSWEKGRNPYAGALAKLLLPKINIYKDVFVKRPAHSEYEEPVECLLLFDGTAEQLKAQKKVIYHLHGGGFTTMEPKLHEDYLLAWATQLKVPILSVNYRKAPEFPYPYALDEVFDTYYALIKSKGTIIGLSGDVVPEVVVTGDSAGGNLAAGLELKLIDSPKKIKRPAGLVLTYPALDMNFASALSEDQMKLIRKVTKETATPFVYKTKKDVYQSYAGDAHRSIRANKSTVNLAAQQKLAEQQPGSPSEQEPGNKLSLTSKVLYSGDRVLPAEVLYTALMLYAGDTECDLEHDYLMSPIRAPEEKIAQFPKTYIICGEVDPLVDDTVLFGAKLRQAFKNAGRKNPEDLVEVSIIKGYSHGFLNMVPFFPEAKAPIHKLGFWMEEIFDNVLPEERNVDINEDDYSTDEEDLVGESYANIDENGSDTKTARKKKTSAQKAWDKTNTVQPGGLVQERQDKTKTSVIGELKTVVDKM